MEDSSIIGIVVFACLFTFVFATIFIGIAYDDKIKNLEYEIAFMKLDLSCEETPFQNILSNYLSPVKHEVLITMINEWYLKECLN